MDIPPRILGIGALAVVALVVVSVASNLVLAAMEKANVEPYGERITVDARRMYRSLGYAEKSVQMAKDVDAP